MNLDSSDFYREHSPITDPGPFAHLYQGLPHDAPALCAMLQGLLIHVFHAKKYGFLVPEDRMQEVQIAETAALLPALLAHDPAPFWIPRPPERRLVASCRHFSVLLCSILRSQGVPARVRCGFEAYFHKGKFGDHWVAEYWDAAQRRWVLVDAQIDDLHRAAFRIAFDPYDLQPDRFAVAGDMWRRCRTGMTDPNLCGMLNVWGIHYVRANVVRDVMCLNKLEFFPWDSAPMIDRPENAFTKDDTALIDRLADMTWPEVRTHEVLEAYRVHPELRAERLSKTGPTLDIGG
ncbi:MAG TPA: transglutaminase-like domain-containing protein [Candidatus Hydrogenedentes bacterium]|nr:transglutaminase-like domain-containing protein [Candidatus Hydrogenedentota bacterium]HOS03997.1 transglutaminase-like domain-containing protein [Candidatus Hydrogenedentota bacterium]